ncbi:MAG: sensor histidine kinase [Massilia sp.]|jgi:two-component system sensor histidine kinase AlgZ|nr:sensor histidine kinase [Massilia sp.]
MQGPFFSGRGAALYLLAWLLLALMLAALVVSMAGAGWINSLLFVVPLLLLYAAGCGFSAYYMCRAWPLKAQQSGMSILAVFCVSAVMASAGWTGLGNAWNALLQSAGVEWAGVAMSATLRALMFVLGVVLYGLSALGNYLAIELARARESERRELQARVAAQDAELRMLRTQIDPHFLFNSLNSISALTSSNPAGARAMTLQLADFFRHSLGLEAHRKVTLAAEVTLALHFLAIEQVRFGDRLQVAQQVADDALACLLPPMILQPLVENAVKHGIGNLTEGGVVRICATRAGSLLRLAVENDVDTDSPAAQGDGIGLANVRQRLAAMYGTEAAIHWSRRGNLFRVELTLPFETKGVQGCG